MQKIGIPIDCMRENCDTVNSQIRRCMIKSRRISKSDHLPNGDFQKYVRKGRKYCCFGSHVVQITWSNDQTRCIIFQNICQETKIFSTWSHNSAEPLSETVSHELFQQMTPKPYFLQPNSYCSLMTEVKSYIFIAA